MEQGVFRLCLGAAAAAVVAVMWTSTAMAARGGADRCSKARGWVQEHCGSPSKTAASREGTPARCARARDWLQQRCSAGTNAPGRQSYRGKRRENVVRYALPRQARIVHRSRATVVYVFYTERPGPWRGWDGPYSRVRDTVYYSSPGYYSAPGYGYLDAAKFWRARDKNLP